MRVLSVAKMFYLDICSISQSLYICSINQPSFNFQLILLLLIANPQTLKLLTRLLLGLGHLRYHKFKHNLLDTINPLCSFRSDIDTTSHIFFLLLKPFRRKKYLFECKFYKEDPDPHTNLQKKRTLYQRLLHKLKIHF